MSMLSNSFEDLAYELHIDIDRRLLAGVEAEAARGETDRAMRAYAEIFLTWWLLELVTDAGGAKRL